MTRYLRRLAGKDIALNRSMIPLGSCTMKLNAATEMTPLSWPSLADIHPFVPAEQSAGYRILTRRVGKIAGATDRLCRRVLAAQRRCTRRIRRSHGHPRLFKISRLRQTYVCLIPQSAHGTNPASAVMAGMRVVVLQTDDIGQVDLADLCRKIEEHKESLAALMLTYLPLAALLAWAYPKFVVWFTTPAGKSIWTALILTPWWD